MRRELTGNVLRKRKNCGVETRPFFRHATEELLPVEPELARHRGICGVLPGYTQNVVQESSDDRPFVSRSNANRPNVLAK